MMKKIIVGVLIIIGLPLVTALFTANSYDVEREIIIAKSKNEVFSYVKLLKNQANFSQWAQIDPAMIKTFRGVDGETGFVSSWHSENPDVGTGEQEIINIIDGERIDYELRFLAPFEATSPAYMIFLNSSGIDTGTTVKWGFSGKLNYPMNIMMWFMDFEQIIGDDLQQGLNNLKVILEH